LSLTPGTRFGVYQVTTQIGEGGMGVLAVTWQGLIDHDRRVTVTNRPGNERRLGALDARTARSVA
jgi:hypothetical protein